MRWVLFLLRSATELVVVVAFLVVLAGALATVTGTVQW